MTVVASAVNAGSSGFTYNANAANNNDTGWGLPLFHENRCIGKAIYALRMESCHDYEHLTGTNTTRVRPIELVLKSDANSPGF